MRNTLASIRLPIALGLFGALPLLGGWNALGPFGGAIAVVQTDPFHADTVLAAASDGLLFQSLDAGSVWQPVPFPGALRGVLRAFLIDPRKPDTYWAAFSGETPQSGLLRSNDAGKTWEALPGLRGKEVWSIAVWRKDPQVMAVGTASGVYLTTDDAQTWRLIDDPSNESMALIVSLAFDPLDRKVLFAGTPHLAWKTVDGGATWRPVHTGMLDDSDVFSIALDEAHPRRVFASACSGIYRSRNGGALWSKLSGAHGASYRTYFVAPDTRQPDTVFAGTQHGLVKSTDGGTTWRQLSTHPTRFVAFDSNHPQRIYVATDDDGVERSDDEGETLSAMNTGLCNRQLSAMLAGGDAIYTHTAYDPAGGIFRLRSNTESWEKLAPAPRLNGDQLQALIPDGTASRWFGAAYNSLVVSTDSGAHWNALSGLPKSRIADLFFAAGGGYLLAATGDGLYRSPDGGTSWKSFPLPAAGRLHAFSSLDPDRVAALGINRIFISKDGMLWEASSPLPNDAEPFGVVDSGSLFVATSTGLERSEDGGKSWSLVRGGLPASTVQAICKHPKQAGVLAVAQYDGVFESQDNGGTWTRISPLQPHLGIRDLTILPETANRLLVLTERQGIFALPLEAAAPGASN